MHWPGDALRDTSAMQAPANLPWGSASHRAGLRAQDISSTAFPRVMRSGCVALPAGRYIRHAILYRCGGSVGFAPTSRFTPQPDGSGAPSATGSGVDS